MECLVCFVVLIFFCNFNNGLVELLEGIVMGNMSFVVKVENGMMVEDGVLKVNFFCFRFWFVLLMLLVEIIKNGNCFNSMGKVCDGLEIFVVDGNILEEILFFEFFKVLLYFLCFSEILMWILYLIVCMCLLILFLMIVKLFVLRRECKKDYDMVIKGEFDV